MQITRNISVSSNSDSEVEFVLERKPPHLRTPEQVNLSELDSDSDVIFVENEKKLPTVIESSSDSSDDNKPLSFTVKRFKAELPGPPSSEFRVEYRLNEENQMPDEVVAGPSGLCGESNASSKYEHKKFYRRKCGELYR